MLRAFKYLCFLSLILGVFAFAFININALPDLGGVDPSKNREVKKFQNYIRDGVEEVKYSYKAGKITGKNIVNGSTERIADNQLRFYSGEQFTEEADGWYQLDYATTTKAKFSAPIAWFGIKKAMADNFFTSADGDVGYDPGAAYGTAHDAADGNQDGTAAATSGAVNYKSGTYGVYRVFLMFDTSIIGAGTITAASINVTSNGTEAHANSESLDVYNTTATSLANPTTSGVFSSCATTEFATSEALTAFNVDGGLHTFALNASGLADINGSGITGMCVRTTGDVANSAPSANNWAYLYMSEQAGTDKDPYLSVTYTAAATPSVYRQPDFFLIDSGE